MEPPNNIRLQIRRYIDGEIVYADFRPWIANEYLDNIAGADSESLRLCRAIEWELADFSEDAISESVLKESLRGLLGPQEVGTEAPAVARGEENLGNPEPSVSTANAISGSYWSGAKTNTENLARV